MIEAALDRVRATSTDQVGTEFRVAAGSPGWKPRSARCRGVDGRWGRSSTHRRAGAGTRARDQVWRQLRITPGEVARRVKLAARLRARRTLTGAGTPPELPVLAAAVAAGQVGETHWGGLRGPGCAAGGGAGR